jgi:ubiquinone/menaquinone biosynthesis C-methylase UbiE
MSDPHNQSVSFDRAADFYDETRGFPPQIALQVVQMMAETANLTLATEVLEIGVGTGRIALPLSGHVKVVYGVDISMNMLRTLQAKQTNEPVYIVQGDATQLPFPDDFFSAACAVHVFHLIPNRHEALRELKRVMKPSAPLLYCFNETHQLEALRYKALETEQPLVGVANWQELEHFLEDEGWHKIRENHLRYHQQIVPNILVEQLEKRTWSRTWFLSDEELQQAKSRMTAILSEHFANPDQAVAIEKSFKVEIFLPPA